MIRALPFPLKFALALALAIVEAGVMLAGDRIANNHPLPLVSSRVPLRDATGGGLESQEDNR